MKKFVTHTRFTARKILPLPIFFSVCLLVFPISAQPAGPKLEGKFSDWATYSRIEGNDKICYALIKAKTKSPKSVKHGDIYFMVANWKSGAATEQPSFLAGFPLKPTSAPIAKVGSGTYTLYVSENEAFIENDSDEKRLVRAMKKGAVMRLSAMSKRGTSVSYEFSLSGITAALKKAKAVCR